MCNASFSTIHSSASESTLEPMHKVHLLFPKKALSAFCQRELGGQMQICNPQRHPCNRFPTAISYNTKEVQSYHFDHSQTGRQSSFNIYWTVRLLNNSFDRFKNPVCNYRTIRKWWKSLPKDKKAAFVDWMLKHKWKFISTIAILIASMSFYYFSHIQETPLTRRKRFIAFTPAQFSVLNQMELEAQLETYRNRLLPTNHYATRRVASVVKQLLDRNKDIEHIRAHEWAVSVIDDENTMNAFVLPSGNIFVFSGLLKMCDNDDQLGIVLAHEISHAILGHGHEMASSMFSWNSF